MKGRWEALFLYLYEWALFVVCRCRLCYFFVVVILVSFYLFLYEFILCVLVELFSGEVSGVSFSDVVDCLM